MSPPGHAADTGKRAVTITVPPDLWLDVQPEAARRLMLAGLQCFAERGYHATTTRDIAAAAGMSSAALYVYFPSKLDLLFAISRSGQELSRAMVEEVLARGGDPVQRMRRLVEEFTSWHARHHTVARVVEYEQHALPDREQRVMRGMRRQTQQIVQDLVAEGVDAGVFQVPDTQAAARAILSLGVDVVRWYDQRMRTSPRTLGRQYAELVLRMLGAGSPAGTGGHQQSSPSSP
jgi:AcrR family transcriptional regulator